MQLASISVVETFDWRADPPALHNFAHVAFMCSRYADSEESSEVSRMTRPNLMRHIIARWRNESLAGRESCNRSIAFKVRTDSDEFNLVAVRLLVIGCANAK